VYSPPQLSLGSPLDWLSHLCQMTQSQFGNLSAWPAHFIHCHLSLRRPTKEWTSLALAGLLFLHKHPLNRPATVVMAPSLPANIPIPQANMRTLSEAADNGVMSLLITAPVLLLVFLAIVIMLVCRSTPSTAADETMHTHSSAVSFGSDPFSRIAPQMTFTSHTSRRATSTYIEVCH
jgi:hypothetical protein